jgi:L-arabinonolactonase
MLFPKLASLLFVGSSSYQQHRPTFVPRKMQSSQSETVTQQPTTMANEKKTIDLSSILQAKTPSKDEVVDYVLAELIVPIHCEVGECVLFDDRRDAVTWTSLQDKKLHELQLNYEKPSESAFATYNLPHRLCSYGMLEEAPEGSVLPLVCAWDNNIQVYDVARGQALSEYSAGEDVNPEGDPTRMNDGRVSREGRFIAGGYFGDKEGTKMKVFKVESNNKKLSHEPIQDNMEVANSICWSLDGETMYMTDSPTQTIHSYKYSKEDGTISNKTVMHKKPEDEPGIPDGSIADAEGYLWNAVCRLGEAAGRVQRVDPQTGKVVFTVQLPDATSQVSCCSFGGKDMDILFITTNCENDVLTDEPNAGGLYAARVPFKGLPESRFKF